MLESLEHFLDQVEVEQDVNGTNNQTVFAFETFALQIQELDPLKYQGQTFSVDLGSVEEATNMEQRIEEGDLVTSETVNAMDTEANTTASIQLPEDLLDGYNLDSCINMTFNLTSATPQRLSYSVFLSDVLFQNVNQSHLKIGSIIVAARLKCADNATPNTPIETTFQINREVRRCAQKCMTTLRLHFTFLHRLNKIHLAAHAQCGLKVI